MTHAELTRDDRQGFASPCPGELAEHGRFDVAGETWTVWRCLDCAARISVSGGTIRNVYQVTTQRWLFPGP